MEQIGIEVFGIIITILFGAIGYLFIQQGKHRDRLLASEISLQGLGKEIVNLSSQITNGFSEVKGEIDKLDNRLDIFIKNELDLLKNIVESNGHKKG